MISMHSLVPVGERTEAVPWQVSIANPPSVSVGLTELSNARFLRPPSTMLSIVISALISSAFERLELATEPLSLSALLYPSLSPERPLSLLFVLWILALPLGAAEALRRPSSECGDTLRTPADRAADREGD